MTDFEHCILKCLGEQFLSDDVHVVRYGSHSGTGDVDLLIVQPQDPPAAVAIMGRLDICIVGRERFQHLVDLLDIMVVDPLLTGSVLAGDRDRWAQLGSDIRGRKPSARAIEHACARSIEEYANALSFARGGGRIDLPFLSLMSLSYSISYASTAIQYRRGARVRPFRELNQDGGLVLPEFWEFHASQKRSVSIDSLSPWLAFWGRWLCHAQ